MDKDTILAVAGAAHKAASKLRTMALGETPRDQHILLIVADAINNITSELVGLTKDRPDPKTPKPGS